MGSVWQLTDWPLLLSLNGEPPPLRSISGQPLRVYGRRLVRMKLDEVPVCFHFYVCVVSYPVILICRLLLQGYKVNVDSPDACTLRIPAGREARMVRHGSLCSAPAPPGLIAPTFNPVYYTMLTDGLWKATLDSTSPSRKTWFGTSETKGRPFAWGLGKWKDHGNDFLTCSDGSKRILTDQWRQSADPCAKVDSFVGRAIFKLRQSPQVKDFQAKETNFARGQAGRSGIELS